MLTAYSKTGRDYGSGKNQTSTDGKAEESALASSRHNGEILFRNCSAKITFRNDQNAGDATILSTKISPTKRRGLEVEKIWFPSPCAHKDRLSRDISPALYRLKCVPSPPTSCEAPFHPIHRLLPPTSKRNDRLLPIDG